ncbi:lipid kinase, YegS/Rv2252/BmrU family [Loktanella fryxellensis]|uniref:Lipid kinase, YegS/Rv2252/BmrU family n=1 Tax=Loktanella fryxellensis TaxID=245187 RepID=A0A1H8G6I3_9RHOB|nr:diacylglycerol kinase family protein [Loktanella fryxellensis]SEN39360.1 lipid kinase, YegS/Rv2252/BmrU family [Loktanella fryxellensis]
MTKPAICVIMNPASGKKKDDPETQALIARMRGDDRIALRLVDHPRQLTRMVETAVSDGFATIVAAGGDGTIAGVTSVLVDHDVTLGVLPMGTFNFVARGLGIPEDADSALDVVLAGHTAPVNLGDVNGKIFLNNASLGAYATILDVREGVYRQWGRSRLAAYWSVIKAMLTLYRPERMTVTVDGRVTRLRSPMAFVATSAYQLEQYEFEGADAIRDGKLVLILAPDANRVRLLLRAVKILMGRISRGHDYLMHVGDEITIETRRKRQLLARDGENERMTGPYAFTMRRDAIRVCVPQGGDQGTS